MKKIQMRAHWQRYYNMLVIVLSRGVGSAIVMALFAIKRWFLPPDLFSSLGLAFATASFVVGPLASPLVMIISRRIIQSKDLSRDRDVILGWALISLALALFAFADGILHEGTASYGGFLVSVCAFMLVSTLNSQYIIWLNESGRSWLSILFICLFVSAIPASMAVRAAIGLRQADRSLALEAIFLCLPVLISTMRIRANEHFRLGDFYEFSAVNYIKYLIVVAFYSGILWTDWTIGRTLLQTSEYNHLADLRILFERILLPALNIAQVTVLWQLLRSSTRGNRAEKKGVSAAIKMIFVLFLATVALVAIGFAFVVRLDGWFMIAALACGYLCYGLTSIFMDFYQAKYSLTHVLVSFSMITALRVGGSWLAISLGSAPGFALFWCLSSIAILGFLFLRSIDQIKLDV